MLQLWEQFNQSSTFIKISFGVILAIWLMVFMAISVGIVILWEEPTVAQPPALDATVPVINLEATLGPVNEPVMVTGQGWTPNSTILFYLASANETTLPTYAVASVGADAAGKFSLQLLIPSDQEWELPGTIKIVAKAQVGEETALALYGLLQAVTGITPSPIVEPSPTPVEATPTPTLVLQTPIINPPAIPVATTTTDLNVRSGPGTGFDLLGLLRAGQTAEILGVSPDSGWWLIKFSGTPSGQGWISAKYTTAQNVDNVPVVQPPALPAAPTATPTSTSTPVVITDWRGEYFNNPNLSGSPVGVRNDPTVDFDWGEGAPITGLGADNFSVRWSRTLNFPAGPYRFYAQVDDGVRLWIDNNLVIDQWHDSGATTYSADITLTGGPHTLKVEYYERGGRALARLTWNLQETFPDWKGEYFANPNLSGAPVLVRNDLGINFGWGINAPGAGLPTDNFSVRWTRNKSFSAGTYRFKVLVDDGVRLWVDDKLVIDQWHTGAPRTYTTEVNLTNGSHRLRLEYFESQYDAQVRLDWDRLDSYPDWKAQYFDNRKLEGDPIVVRNETEIAHNWGHDAPLAGLPADNFSVRWSRKVDVQAGTYLFRVSVDDGVRLWIDDSLVIDGWQDGEVRTLEAERQLSQGSHKFKVEYYERGGKARIEVEWQRKVVLSNQPPQANPGGPYSVDEGSFLVFDGNGSRDPDGNIVSYEWNFNYDNGVFKVDATGPVVTMPYPDGPASATVALRVTDNKGASQIATTSLTVRNVVPIVDAGGPYSGLMDSPISFAGTATDPAVADQAGLSYGWDFGDGSTATGPLVSHSYANTGTYSVKLTVTDKDGGAGVDTTTAQVTTVKQPPKAVISGPTAAQVGELVTFDGTGSSDLDGAISSYEWDFGDGNGGNGVLVTHSYAKAGSYQVSLTVTDSSGLTGVAKQTVTITVPVNEPPQATLNGPTGGLVDDKLSFDGSQSSDPDGNIVSYAWDFGDGTAGNGETVNHSYSAAGTYLVTLTVADDGGLTATAELQVKIEALPVNQPPQVIITAPATALVGQPILLDGTASSDVDGQIVNYSWDLADGNLVSGSSITYTYTVTGTYPITLTVTDDGGLTNSASHSILIEALGATEEGSSSKKS